MKYLFFVIPIILFLGCSSTQMISYRPAGSSEAGWQITVQRSASGNTFQLMINGTVVVEKNVSPTTNSLATRTEYQGQEIILVATYTSGFLGIGTGHEVHVFVNNELAAKLKI
jgi:hypothetical protein